jgi:hypothetical protein
MGQEATKPIIVDKELNFRMMKHPVRFKVLEQKTMQGGGGGGIHGNGHRLQPGWASTFPDTSGQPTSRSNCGVGSTAMVSYPFDTML